MLKYAHGTSPNIAPLTNANRAEAIINNATFFSFKIDLFLAIIRDRKKQYNIETILPSMKKILRFVEFLNMVVSWLVIGAPVFNVSF